MINEKAMIIGVKKNRRKKIVWHAMDTTVAFW